MGHTMRKTLTRWRDKGFDNALMKKVGGIKDGYKSECIL